MLTTRKGNKRFAFYDLKLALAWEAVPASSAGGQAEAEAAGGAAEEGGAEEQGGGSGRGGEEAAVSGEISVADFGSGSDHEDIEVSISTSGECVGVCFLAARRPRGGPRHVFEGGSRGTRSAQQGAHSRSRSAHALPSSLPASAPPCRFARAAAATPIAPAAAEPRVVGSHRSACAWSPPPQWPTPPPPCAAGGSASAAEKEAAKRVAQEALWPLVLQRLEQYVKELSES